MEEETRNIAIEVPMVANGAAPLPEAAVVELACDPKARRPLIVTSYLGRNPTALKELVRLNQLGVGVLESAPNTSTIPTVTRFIKASLKSAVPESRARGS